MKDAFGALRVPAIRSIWVSMLASGLGDWAARLALAVLVLDRTGSAALSALVVALSFLPWVGPGQVLATRLGHLRKATVMIGSDLVRAAVYAVLLLHLPVAAMLVLVLVAALATPPFETARSALTVEAAPGEQYGAAITLLEMTDQSAIVLGYLLGGGLVALGGYRLALLVNVASFLLSAGALSRVRGIGLARAAEPVASQLRRGLHVLGTEVIIRRGLVALLIAAFPVAAVEATAAAYSRFGLDAGAGRTGMLAASVPVGILAVIPLLPKKGHPTRLLRAASLASLAGAVAGGVAFVAGSLAGALVGYLAAGAVSASVTPAQIAFQPRISTEDRPAVFSLLQGLLMGVQALGAVLGGLAADGAGVRRAAVGWMALVAVASLVMVVTLSQRRLDEEAPAGASESPPA